MDMVTVTRQGYKCLRCGHIWVPRKKDYPRICPKCKSPYWDKPRLKDLVKSVSNSDTKE